MAGPRQFPESLEAQLKALESDAELQYYRESRERLAADPARPLYHFSPPCNLMNDPNGLCQWQGRYHLFYQFVPRGSVEPGEREPVCWGHTVSDDLVNWRDLPIALHPAVERDCYSGQTLVEDERVIAMYHGTYAGNGIATAGDPLLLNWQMHPNNPVIPGELRERPGGGRVDVVGGDGRYRVFDPCIWKEDDGYYCVSGTFMDGDFRRPARRRRPRRGPSFSLEGSGRLDLPRAAGERRPAGRAGRGHGRAQLLAHQRRDRHMLLLFSHKRAGRYYIGTYDRAAHRFTPETHGRMNYGPIRIGSLHAPSATIDDAGRYLGIFNVKEGRERRGWNDIMSLPRHYWLADDDTLRQAPAPELEGQRFDGVEVPAQEIAANSGAGAGAVQRPGDRDRGRHRAGRGARARADGVAFARRRRADAHFLLHGAGAPRQSRLAADRRVALLAGG